MVKRYTGVRTAIGRDYFSDNLGGGGKMIKISKYSPDQ
jgi:hypothetical protein